jgi:hypothetical protein
MKKIMKFMSSLFVVLFLLSLSNTNSAKAQDAALCNALFNGNYCDASQLGNCALICYPQQPEKK